MKQDVKLYYTAPSDKVFNDMKKASISVWEEYDNTYGYVDEKVGRIKNIENIRDNFMFMFSMFDTNNQKRFFLGLARKHERK